MFHLAGDLALGLDPALMFAAAVGPPDQWQADALRSRAPRMLWCASRQAGKSVVAAALAVHRATYKAGSLILLISPSQRQSGELFTKARAIYRSIGEPVAIRGESALRLELENSSRIISLPGAEGTIRGYSGVNLLVLDEAARIDDDLYVACRPMLAVSGGRLLALSTPFGRRGWWFEAWSDGGPLWERVRVTAHDCPRISAEFLEHEKAEMDDWHFRQEYMTEFADNADAAFNADLIRAALSDDVKPLIVRAR